MRRRIVDLNVMKSGLFLFAILLVSLRAGAQERYYYYQGIRQMGMGGASVATVNDETALIANPAALGKLRDYFITVADPEIDVGVNAQPIAGTSELQMTNPQTALNKCVADPDKHLHERVQMFPSIVVPNFGIGIYGKYQVDAEDTSSSHNFMYDYTNDFALVMGVNFRLFNGILKIGTNARIDNRTQVMNSTIADNSTNLTLQSLASSGVGVGSDTGMILTAPIAMLPTLAAVWRDVGTTAYTVRGGMMMTTATPPTPTPDTLDVGLGINPILGKRMRSSWTVEYQDALTYSQEKDQMRRVHAGVEFNYADALFLRAGMNQRYWTAGVELSMMNYQFQAASYGEDIGPVGAPLEDRRYEVKFAFRF